MNKGTLLMVPKRTPPRLCLFCTSRGFPTFNFAASTTSKACSLGLYVRSMQSGKICAPCMYNLASACNISPTFWGLQSGEK